MKRLPLTLIALLALLFAAPLHAQDDAPDDTPDTDPLIGTWEGIEMDGEAMPEGEMHITFNADGTGTFTERGGEADDFTYTHDPEGKAICTIYMEEEDPFSFEVEFDGNTATFTPTDDDGPPPLVVRRVVDEDAGDAMPRPAELADMSDSPLVGRWALVSFNGEALPEDVNLEFENSADGTGASFENGEPSDTYTWQHDFETGIVTFVHGEGEEPAAFTFVIENGVATYISTDETMTIVERRIDSEDAIDEMNDASEVERDTIIGTWYVQRMADEWIPADSELRLEFRDDGTAHFFENGVPEDEGIPFQVDEEASTIELIIPEEDAPAFAIRYLFVDDVLMLTFTLDGVEEGVMELYRLPGGNAEQQKSRQNPLDITGTHPVNGDGPRALARRSQSMSNLQQLSMGVYMWASDHNDFAPESLGVFQLTDYFDHDAGMFLAPWQTMSLPDDWAEMDEQDQVNWLDANTGYGYIGSALVETAMKEDSENAVMIFELPLYSSTEFTSIAFVDGHCESITFDEADALIEEQTGKDLMQWMEDMGREQIPVGDDADDVIEEEEAAEVNPHGGHFHADGTYSDGRSIENQEELSDE